MPVFPFDDLEDMFREMNRDKEEADKRVQPWQAAIKPGDYFTRWSRLGFHIYGQILEEEEPRAPGLEHYRLCRAYSVACPDGELGDVHVSTIDRIITETEFKKAEKRGWF